MGRLEDLRAKQAGIINWLRDTKDRREALRDQIVKSIDTLAAQDREIESAYEKLRHVEDEILRLSQVWVY